MARLDVRVNETTWMVAGWLLAAAIVTPASAARIAVPRDASTIQAAVDIAAPGDTIVVGPGVYAENVRLRAGDDGLTIAAADAARPPLLVSPGRRSPALRIEGVEGVTLRDLVVKSSTEGVRIRGAHDIRLVRLRIEEVRVGVALRGVDLVRLDDCGIAGARAQGIRVDGSRDVSITDGTVQSTRREGVLVRSSPGTVMARLAVSAARARDAIAIRRSPDSSVRACSAIANGRGGIRVLDSTNVTIADNRTDDNGGVGLRVDRSHPIRSTDDLVAAGNRAAANRTRDMLVTAPRCRARRCAGSTTTTPPAQATTTTRATSTSTTTRVTTTTSTSTKPAPTSLATTTTTSVTTTSGALTRIRFRFYVRMRVAPVGIRNVAVPYRSIDPPLEIAIATAHATAFKGTNRVTADELAKLGGDTLQRLNDGVTAYLTAHFDDYPGYAGLERIRWAQRDQ